MLAVPLFFSIYKTPYEYLLQNTMAKLGNYLT